MLGLVVLCCGSGIAAVWWGSGEAAKIAPLKDACLGSAVAVAPALGSTPGIQRVVAFERSGSTFTSSYSLVSTDWRGETAETTPLVLCAEPETQELVERCSYGRVLRGDATLERWGYRRDVRLVEARTGRVIVSTTLRGTPPLACPETESFGRSSTERRYGTHVGVQEIETVIGPTVRGSTGGPVVPLPTSVPAPVAPTPMPPTPMAPAPAPVPVPPG